MKKILLISQFFYPENFKSNDIAFEMTRKGYEVHVLAGIPNYPRGKYYEGYGLFRKRIESIEGVKIFRSFQFPRGVNTCSIKLALNYLSFALCASVWSLFLLLFNRYEVIIIHQTSPITQSLPALCINFFRKTPIILWVLDLWPEAYLSGSGRKPGLIYKLLNWFTKTIYQKSTKILISSKAFRASILGQGNFSHKIIYFPNWSIDFKVKTVDFVLPELPDGFIIMFAGNIGISQDVESILNLALEFKDDHRVKFVIIGDGSKRKWLTGQIDSLDLGQVLFLLGQYPLEWMPNFYDKADAMLLTLSGDFLDLNLYVPAKLQSYLSSGKPILGMINGASNELINEIECGYAVGAGKYKEMADVIRNKLLPNILSLSVLGQNGRLYYENFFTQHQCIENLCRIIDDNINS